MIKLTVTIHCHNRPAYAKRAIESALRQTNQDFRLVISDNSSNDELCDLVRAKFPGIDYRRRPSTLPAIDHFNLNIAESETDFICLFHDDDLMMPDFVDMMLKTIERYPHGVAYSCNAEIIDEEDKTTGQCFECSDPYVIIKNPRALAGRYFSRHPNGFAPFPAYIYRCSVVKNLPLNSQTAGKYSDFTWLIELSKIGTIVWNSQKLMQYRMHAANDGGIESSKGRFKLLGFLKKNKQVVGQAIINDYRFFLYKKFCKSGASDHQFSTRVITIFHRYLLMYRFKRFSRAETYSYICYKISKRFN
ncbi:MAG: glycosyltransferase family 2 protein [Burkholderiaceae bacterium]